MSTFTVTIDHGYKIWETAAPPKDNTRPILQGIYIDSIGYAVATDGFILAAVPITITPTGFPSALVPASFLKQVWKDAPQTRPITFDITLNEDSTTIVSTGTVCAGEAKADLLPYIFPKWRNLANATVYGTSPPMHVAYHPAEMLKVLKAIGREKDGWADTFFHPSHGPALIVSKDDAYGLVMPCYSNMTTVPESVRKIFGG